MSSAITNTFSRKLKPYQHRKYILLPQMAFQPTPTDISVIISTPASAQAESSFITERRITPTWTVMQLKSKLETMTGIPPGSQHLRVKVPGRADQWAEGDERIIADWGLVKGSEIEVGGFVLYLCFFFFSASRIVISGLSSLNSFRSMILGPRQCDPT